MKDNGLNRAYGRKKFKGHPNRLNEADPQNLVARSFGGQSPRTHVCRNLTNVRVTGEWNYVCLPHDLAVREVVGQATGPHKNANLMRAVFATPEFPISDIEIFHADRGSELDNAVDESTNKILKAEFVYREAFGMTDKLQMKPMDYMH